MPFLACFVSLSPPFFAAQLPLVIINFYNWQVDKVLQGHFPGDAWTGEYFWELWGVTALYFFADLVWVLRVPICVKSPGVIIKVRFFCLFDDGVVLFSGVGDKKLNFACLCLCLHMHALLPSF